jgi:hypothetical protein
LIMTEGAARVFISAVAIYENISTKSVFTLYRENEKGLLTLAMFLGLSACKIAALRVSEPDSDPGSMSEFLNSLFIFA